MSDYNPKSSEIEITSEMIDAGADEVRDYDPDFVTPQQAARQIYLAMEAARRRAQSLEF